jgi:hypothetical protein
MLVMDNLNRLQNSGQDIIFVKRKKLWRRRGVNKKLKPYLLLAFKRNLYFYFNLSKVYIYIGANVMCSLG